MLKTTLCLACVLCHVGRALLANPVLRYNLNSCTSLEPSLVNENWAYPGGGEKQWLDEALFSSPRRSRDRSPPFSIQIEFNQYRRDREYQGEDEDSLTFSHRLSVRIEAAEYYDSFLLQTRGKDQPDGNATLIGWFVSIPNICKDLHCYDKSKSSVVDKGRPIKLGNLTFTWRSPATDYGAIKFVASIVVGQEYHVIESNQISFNNFPVSIKGCGREMSCFRSCSTSPICDPEDSDTMAVMYLTGDKRNIVVSLGGVVQDENRDFIWCQFRRPLRPRSMWDLDLSQPLFHFFFKGKKNNSMVNFPERNRIWASPMRRNFTEIMNDIMFSGGSNESGIFSPFGALLTVFITSVTYFY